MFESALIQLKNKQDLMLITIIECIGSAPRGVGAKMWVSGEGNTDGTIGGGMIENIAIRKASHLIKEGKHHLEEYNLGAGEAADIGMVCGGKVLLSYFYISHQDGNNLKMFEQIAAQFEKRQETWLIVKMDEKNNWAVSIDINPDGKSSRPVLKKSPEVLFYIEPIVKNETVFVFGGGHVAQQLVPLLKTIGFNCVVFDDRKEFANDALFPSADQVICSDFENIEGHIELSNEDYVVIMTRGHKYDLEVQAWALKHKPYYIGVMGSRKKIAFVTQQLVDRGFERTAVEACHMPIGTPIKAETPAEIAVSVAGELIQVCNSK